MYNTCRKHITFVLFSINGIPYLKLLFRPVTYYSHSPCSYYLLSSHLAEKDFLSWLIIFLIFQSHCFAYGGVQLPTFGALIHDTRSLPCAGFIDWFTCSSFYDLVKANSFQLIKAERNNDGRVLQLNLCRQRRRV